MDPTRRDFYAFHSCLMEPWDGPAGVVFTDGTQIGAVLDRNGLRPGRLLGHRRRAGGARLRGRRAGHPGREGRAEGPAAAGPDVPGRPGRAPAHLRRRDQGPRWPPRPRTGSGWSPGRILLSDLPEREHVVHTHASVTRRQQVFGYTEEELRLILAPMATGGAEPIGSMGTDTPIAALSDKPRLLFDYFSQLFAQVTNPPLDAIREELVTSLYNTIGPERNLLDPGPASCRRLVLPFPVLDNDALAKIVKINRRRRPARLRDLRGPRAVRGQRRRRGAGGQARRALRRGLGGDRRRRPDHRAVRPALQRRAGPDPVAAAHRGRAPPPGPGEDPHPGRPGGRGRRRPRGAPRRAADRLRRGRRSTRTWPSSRSRTWPGTASTPASSRRRPSTNVVKALGKGVLKVMSKMGVSTVASYTGAQIFEALGLSQDAGRPLLHRHHLQARRASGWSELAEEVAAAAPDARTRPTASRWPTGCCRWAGSTSGGARASRTCSTRRPCSGCSTRPGPGATTSSSSTPSTSTTSPSG